MKPIYKSKRAWAGVIALITGISLVATGEESLMDAIPELAVIIIGLVQTIIALTSSSTITLGSKTLN